MSANSFRSNKPEPIHDHWVCRCESSKVPRGSAVVSPYFPTSTLMRSRTPPSQRKLLLLCRDTHSNHAVISSGYHKHAGNWGQQYIMRFLVGRLGWLVTDTPPCSSEHKRATGTRVFLTSNNPQSPRWSVYKLRTSP